MEEIIVIDYHKGNLKSVERGIIAAGGRARISDDPDDIARAAAVVLPGVGAFSDAMDFMDASGQSDAVREVVRAGRPFLGICLGAQLIFSHGDEVIGADTPSALREGLGLFDGLCTRLPDMGLKIPHVGWDQVRFAGTDEAPVKHPAGFWEAPAAYDDAPAASACPLLRGVPDAGNYYFTHSYAVVPDDVSVVAAWTDYGVRFPSVVARDVVFACQFHPEKSSSKGLVILRNFIDIVEGRRSV